MAAITEREIKLRCDSPAAARAALTDAGATPLRPRRLQHDALLDTADGHLRRRRSVLRVRREPHATTMTFKGPVDSDDATMKSREEVETAVADGAVLMRLLHEIGFTVWFEYEKYREEYSWNDVVAAVDETPLGTFIELEGSASGIEALTAALGRRPGEYLRESYRGLYVHHCTAHGLPVGDMLFEPAR